MPQEQPTTLFQTCKKKRFPRKRKDEPANSRAEGKKATRNKKTRHTRFIASYLLLFLWSRSRLTSLPFPTNQNILPLCNVNANVGLLCQAKNVETTKHLSSTVFLHADDCSFYSGHCNLLVIQQPCIGTMQRRMVMQITLHRCTEHCTASGAHPLKRT